MKKRSLLSLLIILALVSTLLCSLTVTASAAVSGGTVTIDSTSVSASDDGYYYVNQEFDYEMNSDAESYFYVEFSAVAEFTDEDGDVLSGETLYAMDGIVEDTLPAIDTDDDAEPVLVYYVFADVYDDGDVSNARVVCFDTVAPTIDAANLTAWLESSENGHDLYLSWVPAGDDYEMPGDWAEDTTIVGEVTALDGESNNMDMLEITVEYCSPSDYYDEEDWSSCDIDSDFDIDEVGNWVFRFVVEDMAGNRTTSEPFVRMARSTAGPTITFTSSNLTATSDGITAGETYTIIAPTTTDSLGTTLTTTYVVYKLVDGQYIQIFDSVTEEVTEGYEDYITLGYLTPGEDEESQIVDASYEYLYLIDYTAVDGNGMSVTETLSIRVNAPTTLTGIASLTTWEWVLIGVSVASAIGIVCLLVIKPKSKETAHTA